MTVCLLKSRLNAGQVAKPLDELAARLKIFSELWEKTKPAGTELEYVRTFVIMGIIREDVAKDRVDTEDIYDLCRRTAPGSPRARVLNDQAWHETVEAATVSRADTSIEGKYRIEGVAGGEYFVYAMYYNKFSLIEWLFPLKVDKQGELTCDLHNNKARTIYNKKPGDDD
jgi:hypothetical protein